MCFSASASFGAGVVLSMVGVASVKKAKNTAQTAFASIPLIFAVQQISEGFLWLSFTRPSFIWMQLPCTYVFLFFAQVLWPIWVPYSFMRLEKKSQRNISGKTLVFVGALVSLVLAYCLLIYPVRIEILDKHIAYHLDYPRSVNLFNGTLYIIATIVPTFFSSFRNMWMLGVTILGSYVISAMLYDDTKVSVWCFFASIISIGVYFLIQQNHFNIPKGYGSFQLNMK